MSVAPARGLTARPAWKALAAHCESVRGLHLRQLFADHPARGERYAAVAMYEHSVFVQGVRE